MTLTQRIGALVFLLLVLWGIGIHHMFPLFERAGAFQFQ